MKPHKQTITILSNFSPRQEHNETPLCFNDILKSHFTISYTSLFAEIMEVEGNLFSIIQARTHNRVRQQHDVQSDKRCFPIRAFKRTVQGADNVTVNVPAGM